MRLPWSALGLVGAIASSIPLASSHEIHLAYLPSTESDNQIESYLVSEPRAQEKKKYVEQHLTIPIVSEMVYARWFSIRQQ